MATDQNLILEHEFNWPMDTEVEEPVIVDEEAQEQRTVVVLDGVWSGVLTPDGTCWMLENDAGVVHMLADSTIASWTPERGSTGTYQAQQSEANIKCSRFTAESLSLIHI